MSTLEEINESRVSIIMKPKENIIQSFVKDLVTFSMIAFCIYISQGSTWWTFITGSMFIFVGGTKLLSFAKLNTTTFSDKDSAIAYLEKEVE